MSTQPMIPGLPPGAVTTPISGLPPGAVATPLGGPPAAPPGMMQIAKAPAPTGLQQVTSELSDRNQPAYAAGLGMGPVLSGAIKDTAGMVGNILHMINQNTPEDNSTTPAGLQQPQMTRTPAQDHVEDAAKWLRSGGQPQGFWENVGSIGVQSLQWLGGGELLKLAGPALKVGETANATEHLTQAKQVADVLAKNPKIAGLITLGLKASKDALGAAGLNFAHTGDPEQALEAGALTGGITAGVGSVVQPAIAAGERGVNALEASAANTPEARAAAKTAATAAEDARIQGVRQGGAQEFTRIARETARQPLEDLNAAGDRQVTMNQPGGAPGVKQTVPNPNAIDIDKLLDTTHDFTGVKDRLMAAGSDGYDQIDRATNGRFRQLNGELQEAKKAALEGGPREQAQYEAKQQQLDALMESAKSQVNPKLVDASKAIMRRSYVLDDFAGLLDKSVDGVPGASRVSQEQRGLNGKILLTGLRQAVNKYGRSYVAEAIGGEQRLEALQELGQQTQTLAQRQKLNEAVQNIIAPPTHLPFNHYAAMSMGAAAGHFTGVGSLAGAGIGAGIALTYPQVIRAIQANPTIARNVLFAIRSGARPAVYGPMIAKLIQDSNQGGDNQP